jgi:uncharacterized membrane protein YdjX (TVP38/TMEM64 family)
MSEEPLQTGSDSNGQHRKFVVFAIVVIAAIVTFLLMRKYFSLEYLSQVMSSLKTYYDAHPLIVYSLAFVIYVVVTGLSIPGATVLSLVYAWFFGFTRGLILISFASTAGATVAFLLSRYLFRDWIQSRFGARLKAFNEALEQDGAVYLFTLRLVPAVPFFVINAVMGLTRLRAWTFWWVSQLGMLAGTAVYVYAGSIIPDLQTIEKEGVNAIFTTSQLTQITIAFVLLGLFPLVVKKLARRFGSSKKISEE